LDGGRPVAAGLCCPAATGRMTRASASLNIPVTSTFLTLIPVQVVGLVFVFVVSCLLGLKEEKRLGLRGSDSAPIVHEPELSEAETKLRRPGKFWINLVLTIVVLGVMISGKVDPVVMFMSGVVLALMINYPDVNMQRARIDAHAKAA